MTGQSSPDPNDWAALWSDAQQKYWKSWTDLSQNLAQPKEATVNPWAQNFETWAKLMTNAVPAESRDWASKLADLNRGYLQMGETFWKMLSANQNAASSSENWWNAVNDSLKKMQAAFTTDLSEGKDPWAGFATFWGMPMDNWRRVYSACSAMPGDMAKALRGFGAPGESPESALQRLFATPSLGYTREWQEDTQRWQQRWLEHSQAAREYGSVLAGITAKAAESLCKKLLDLAGEGKTPETLRAFYDLWVDCGEQAYAETAVTPEFTKAQARLVNTLMALKRQEQDMVDEALSALNMPTRKELDTSHRRIHQLQRQVWRLQEQLEGAGILELREEVAALRRDVEARSSAAEPPPKRATARNSKSAEKT
jgi:class III poly(R)-hydroxyalkanoic acid synthase PhaE subunit